MRRESERRKSWNCSSVSTFNWAWQWAAFRAWVLCVNSIPFTTRCTHIRECMHRRLPIGPPSLFVEHIPNDSCLSRKVRKWGIHIWNPRIYQTSYLCPIPVGCVCGSREGGHRSLRRRSKSELFLFKHNKNSTGDSNLKLGPSVFIWVSACSCFSCRSTSLSASQQTTVPLEECGKGAAWCVSMILLNANKGVQSHLHNQGL